MRQLFIKALNIIGARCNHEVYLCMKFCVISFKHPYKQSDRWQDVLDSTKYSIDSIDIALILIIY